MLDSNHPQYYWRKLTEKQRQEVLAERQHYNLSWHGPTHYESSNELYLLTAACYEHKAIIGLNSARMAEFERDLCHTAQSYCQQVYAWTILPNHYHILVHAPTIKSLLVEIGKLHGRTSYRWNEAEDRCKRKVWHRCAETAMKSDGHFWSTLNYVLNNAVKHGYVNRWLDWPYCNAEQYLNEVGRETAERRWREFPVLDYGKDWDPADL